MADDLFDIEAGEDGPGTIVLRVRVQPGAGRSAITGRHGDALALRVAAPPLEGRANAECVGFVADVLGVRRSQVELVSGDKSRQKRLRVSGIDPARAGEIIAGQLRVVAERSRGHNQTGRQGARS